jgi:predicted ATPase/predicted Ser/Thr protein kinase
LTLSSPRHGRISDLFLRACDLDPKERAAFLEEACAGEPELRKEIESLLSHDEAASRFFESGAGGARVAAILSGENDSPDRPGDSAPACSDCGAPILPGQVACPACATRSAESVEDEPRIPGYRILKLLGEGGMGKVYLAEETTLGRRVAIKLISKALAGSVRAVSRFTREARMMAAVEHPNIVRVYTFGQTDGHSYLVMEYVEGESLAQRLRRDGRIGVDESLEILRQTVVALNAAWQHGIIHRDVKPSNMLIDAQDQVHVADFGLARATESRGDVRITHAGEMVGTPHYVSPEQALGESDVDFRSDVYSLGIVLYEMLTGQPPFDGATPVAVAAQHLQAPLPSVRSSRPEVADEVEQLCGWMTRKRPTDRPGSYDDVLRNVETILGRDAVQATAPRPLPPVPEVEAEVEEGIDRTRPVFVGRAGELESLGRLLEGALAGKGRVVFVTGEAGSGKTALIDEFARRSQQRHADLIVAGGNCDAQTGVGDPYLPFREVLGLLTGDVEAKRASGAITADHARRLWNLLPLATQALLDGGPDLVGTLLAPDNLVSRAAAFTPSPAGWRVRLEELARRRTSTPRDVNLQQSYLFEQCTKTLQQLAKQQPLLLELEDLHWADPGSCALLFHLARCVAGHRVLIVGTYRPAEIELEQRGERHPLHPTINELRRLFGDLELALGEEGTRELVDALLDSEPNNLPEGFREALYQRTKGHPLFTVELLRSMRDQGMLTQDPEGCWIEGAALEWGTLPGRVEGAIGERMSRLSPELREVLSLASVQGEYFVAEVLAEVRGAAAREMAGLLSRELNQRHRLVSVHGVRRANGRRISTYRFRHILFQTYLYDRMDDVERSYLHEEVGTALETLVGEDVEEVAVQLAWHFEEAGVIPKAIQYLQQAGDRAVRLSANEEAIAHLTRALGLLDQLPDAPDRETTELALQLALGAPLLATAGPGSAELFRAYTRARELCDRVGNAPQLFQTLFLLVHHHANNGELGTALELAEQLLQVAESAEEPLPVVMAYWARGFVSYFLGRNAESRDDFARVVELYDAERDSSLAYVFGMDPAVSALSIGSLACWFLGLPGQALEQSEHGLAVARELDHPASLAHALAQSTGLAMFLRDVETLRDQTDTLLRLSTEKGVVLFRAFGTFVEGWLLVEGQQTTEGIARLRQGLAAIEAAGSLLGRPFLLAKLAEAHGKAGNAEEGLTVLSDATSVARKTGDRTYEAELLRLEGELLLERGASAAPTEAEVCFRRALDCARETGARSWELRATTSLSRLLLTRGDRDEARRLLSETYGRFTEGFGTRDLKEAKALLDELS